ncbi:MAG: aldehyde ferredoxin oxidoreductase family protein [Bacillota bacterium]|nr:aldehyde ferredoxin oxidoreductase family protein [Bacillota bacterium]
MKTGAERWCGYAGRVLRVDLDTGRSTIEPLDREAARRCLGGRGLNMQVLYDEVHPEVDPLSPENRLMFATGPLVGTAFSGASRVNVSARSPLTGILGDSNAGGFFGPELKYAGFDQVIIRGRAPDLTYLLITEEGACLRPAGHLRGQDVWQTQQAIRAELGDEGVQVGVAGPAAENGVLFAGVFFNLARPAARTGMGAVMAAKNLKAVAVRGRGAVRVADRAAFDAAVALADAAIFAHPEYEPRKRLGTTRLVRALHGLGCLASFHFRTGRFPGVERVSGEHLAATYRLKGKACFGCNIPCSRFFRVDSGPFAGLASEGPEFEGLAGFSSRVGNDDLALALRAIDMCNRYGMDVISTSEVISFLMELAEAGIVGPGEADGLDLRWGSGRTILALIEKICRREGIGEVLAGGVRRAAQLIGRRSERYAMHIKGMEVFQADPRGIKGYALGLAVASRGGDHLRSEPWFELTGNREEALRRFGVAEAAERLAPAGKGVLVKHYEERCALADCLEVCKNTLVNMEILPYDQAARVLSAATGWEFSEEEVRDACERLVNLERCYNARLGLGRRDDTLPERFTREPLPPDSGPSAGSVVELDRMLDEYYRARGWDESTGLPKKETLSRLGLEQPAP